MNCHPDRSVAEWRDLLSIPPASAPDEQAGGLQLAEEYSLLIKRTADPSASLGMTKERVALPIGVMAVMTTSRNLRRTTTPW
jgi:hypothetical protein